MVFVFKVDFKDPAKVGIRQKVAQKKRGAIAS